VNASATIHVIDTRKRHNALVASQRAAAKRRAAAAAGLLRIDGEVVIAIDKARELQVAAKDLRAIVGFGFSTTPEIRRWIKSGQRPHVFAEANRR